MRADRLLSLLMLLQARGRMTAADLARELEVSVRTVYRDVIALSTAGVPVYTESGPGGGCALVEGYRTTLTGLTTDEARALFMLSIPEPLSQLGVGKELKAALLKIVAALPAARRGDEERGRNLVYVDAVGWSAGDEAAPHLQTLYRAVCDERKLRLVYRTFRGIELTQLVEPYGLVAKAGTWHLVYASQGRLRTRRVAEIQDARLTEARFTRPADFDLAAFWQAACAEQEANRLPFQATVRISPALTPHLPRTFGPRVHDLLAQAGARDAEGWVTLALPFESFEAARDRILGFGGAAEVLAPEALRRSVADFAAQVVARYKL